MTPMTNASVFLIKVIFDLYIFVMLVRLLLQLHGASPFNPISKVIIQVTRPLVMSLQKLLPSLGKFNLSVAFWLIALETIKLMLLGWIGTSQILQPLGLMAWSLGSLIGKLMNLYFFAILIQVILSWVQPRGPNPFVELLYTITTPIMRPIQRVVPTFGVIDISPIFALIGIQLVNILITQPIISFGASLAMSGIGS